MARILVIDDDPDFVMAVRIVLEGSGFEVQEAATAEEGIEKALNVEPDLVVLDVMMPAGYEGFEVARALREEHGLKHLPIVILTSLHRKHEVPYRFAPDETYLPVDVFLDKPIKPEALVETIDELLGQRREEPKHPL
jgi:CheY-like chemotaxis protein